MPELWQSLNFSAEFGTAVPKLTQSSTLRGTVEWVSAGWVIIANDDGGCGLQQTTGGITAKVSWLGLRVGSHLALSLHSSNEPVEFSQCICASWQHHKHRRGIIIIFLPRYSIPREWKKLRYAVQKSTKIKSSWNEPYSSSSFTKQSCIVPLNPNGESLK